MQHYRVKRWYCTYWVTCRFVLVNVLARTIALWVGFIWPAEQLEKIFYSFKDHNNRFMYGKHFSPYFFCKNSFNFRIHWERAFTRNMEWLTITSCEQFIALNSPSYLFNKLSTKSSWSLCLLQPLVLRDTGHLLRLPNTAVQRRTELV